MTNRPKNNPHPNKETGGSLRLDKRGNVSSKTIIRQTDKRKQPDSLQLVSFRHSLFTRNQRTLLLIVVNALFGAEQTRDYWPERSGRGL